jgi:four helix bundle protein
MKYNIIQDKTFQFALRIIKAYTFLTEEKKEFVLSKQLLRSGTSIGANVEEAIWWHSKADFLAKLSIAYKEARESHYWIRLLQESWIFSEKESKSLLSDLEEILKIIGTIRKTWSKSLNS